MDLNWYKTFFQGTMLEMWRKAIPPEYTRREVDFLERALKLVAGARVLDIPCGLGRHTLELAARGYRVTGVDLSPHMIEGAQTAAAEAGLDIEWQNTDMLNFVAKSDFDGAFCFGNSFAYVDTESSRKFLQAVARALKPGARFALDYGMTAESILPRLREREWTPVEDMLFLEHNHYHLAEGCIETTYTLVRDGRSETKSGLQWVHTVRELRQMLRDAGLETEQMLQSIDGAPFAVGSMLLILVAQKAA